MPATYVLTVLARMAAPDQPLLCETFAFATQYPTKRECLVAARTLPEPFAEVYEGWHVVRYRCAEPQEPAGEES